MFQNKNVNTIKPINRSKFRMTLGQFYFRSKRYISWIRNNRSYANEINNNLFEYVAFTHKTPLLRQLKDVDMWMQYNKVKNIEIAIEKLNNIIIYPGQTFSYWKLIGKPSKRKGYVDGMVLHYGKLIKGIGGGLCQLSNLIYWMTLHTDLTIIERHRHSYDVFPDSNRTQPFGSGAICVYNYRDLQIFNETDKPYQLSLSILDSYLVGEWRTSVKINYRYEVYEKKHLITHEYWGDYVRHNLIHRKKYDINKNYITDEYVTENHALMMYQPFLEYEVKQ